MVYRVCAVLDESTMSPIVATDMTADEIRNAWAIVFPRAVITVTRLR